MELLQKLIGKFKDPIEIDPENALEEIESIKKEEFNQMEEKVQRKREKFEEQVQELEEKLKELEDFKDEKERALVEDVVDNIREERKKLIDNLSFPEDARKLETELGNFVNNFSTMSRKEAAVMKTIPVNKEINDKVAKIESNYEDFRDFLEKKYSAKEDYEKLKEEKKKLEDKRQSLEEKKEELEEISSEDIDKELKEKKKELENLRNSEEWRDYKDLKDRLKDKKERKETLKGEKNKALNKMERGLKKLVYRIENTDLDFEGDLKLLKKIRDKDEEYIEQTDADKVEETVKESLKSLPDGLIDQSQEKKFVEGAEKLGDISSTRERIEELNGKIGDLRERIENHEVLEKEQQIAEEKKDLESKLNNREKEIEELKQKIIDLKSEKIEKEEEFRDKIKSVFEREVRLKPNEEPQ